MTLTPPSNRSRSETTLVLATRFLAVSDDLTHIPASGDRDTPVRPSPKAPDLGPSMIAWRSTNLTTGASASQLTPAANVGGHPFIG